MSKALKVNFQPANVTVEVAAGTPLVDAAQIAGVPIEIPCGGQGRCGRCMVKIDSGEVSQRFNPHLTKRQIEEGWALSCTARVESDVVLTIPARKVKEKVVAETAAHRKAVEVQLDWEREPVVRKYFVQIPVPSLEDNLNDTDRVRRELTTVHNMRDIDIPLPVMRKMAEALRSADWNTTLIIADRGNGAQARLIGIEPGDTTSKLLGIAIDIGTTTNVAYLTDLNTGKIIDTASTFNGQISYGEDVISRIVYAQRGSGLQQLQEAVVGTLNGLLTELAERNHFATEEIHDVVVAGNTTMTHLFLGLPPRTIREEPYVPTIVHGPQVTAAELGLKVNPNAFVYAMPSVAAYVGGDITAGVLSSGQYKTEYLTLFMDVGTNGEIVLGNADWLMTVACSAGPAFEGAGVDSGMRATTGAIEEVRVSSLTLESTVKVIGDGKPRGICGSGMISALAEMLVTGVLDKSGKIRVAYVNERMGEKSRTRVGDHGPEFVVAWASETEHGRDIVLTEVDINNLVRTKAAIYAGMTSMARGVGIDLADVEQVLVGGAFGQHINVEQAIQIGLLPDLPWDKFKFLGNTSAQGAFKALLSKEARKETDEIASKMTYMELIADNTFMDEFMSAMFLPHTDVETFPSVKVLLGL